MKQARIGGSTESAERAADESTKRLRTILLRYERKALKAEHAQESVSVDVSRQAGLLHHATTPGGLRLTLDEPLSFGGGGTAPDPAECLLAAVGASVSVTLTAYASLRNVSIDGIHIALSASIDARQFFRPSRNGRAGLLDATLTVTVSSPSPRQAIRTLFREVLQVAPVLKALKRRPHIRLVFDPKAPRGTPVH